MNCLPPEPSLSTRAHRTLRHPNLKLRSARRQGAMLRLMLVASWMALQVGPALADGDASIAAPAATPPGLTSRAPAGLRHLVTELMQRPAGQPARTVWAVVVGGENRYYVTAPCCDQLNELYDLQAVRLCAPDGGFTGRGDGQCPQWQVDKSRGRRVWTDPRTR